MVVSTLCWTGVLLCKHWSTRGGVLKAGEKTVTLSASWDRRSARAVEVAGRRQRIEAENGAENSKETAQVRAQRVQGCRLRARVVVRLIIRDD